MGLSKEEKSNKLKEMKLIATLAAVASASWNGVSSDNTCGMQISGDSMINATCTVSGSSIAYTFAGNGAFITGANTFTGYDGMSGDVDMVVFFDQDCSSGECDNSTCWDASVSCTANGAALSLDLAGFACQNISAPFGTVSATADAWGNIYSDDGTFSVTVNDEPFGDLFQISITQQPGQTSALNLWASSVSN